MNPGARITLRGVSSSTPPEPPQEQDAARDENRVPEPDEADTDPLQARWSLDPDSDFFVSQHNWAPRFDAPVTVTPRQVQRRRNSKLLGIGAAVGAVAVVGGLILWLTGPTQDTAQPQGSEEPTTSRPPEPTALSEDGSLLLRQLPKGYPTGACELVSAPESVLSQVDCAQNTDPGGPSSATYSLVADSASLAAVFEDALAVAMRVDCPGNIQSPGPWRRNATPDKISGQLFCGLLDGQPTVVWTDEGKMTVSAVRAGPAGPTFPQLYAWWSSHS